jgi:hypothetical protein
MGGFACIMMAFKYYTPFDCFVQLRLLDLTVRLCTISFHQVPLRFGRIVQWSDKIQDGLKFV